MFGLAACYPFFIERYIVLTNLYRIPVPHLPDTFSGFRVVHLTDFHYGFLMPMRMIRHVIARANRIRRDITVCTGDYAHERNATGQIDAVWPHLAELQAPGGVFSVLGNHDHWADTDRSRYWLNRAGQDLHHTVSPIIRNGERIWLAGVGDYWEDHRNLDDSLRDIPDTECRIVLAHNPDTADTEHASRVDLMLSGHTHGGQVKIPFGGNTRSTRKEQELFERIEACSRRHKRFHFPRHRLGGDPGAIQLLPRDRRA